MRRINQYQSIERTRPAPAKDTIRLGHRRKPSLSINITHVSRRHNESTSGSRPLLGNRRGTVHHAPFGSGTTMQGAFPKSRPTHQRRAIHRRSAVRREASFTWVVEVHCDEQTRLFTSDFNATNNWKPRIVRLFKNT